MTAIVKDVMSTRVAAARQRATFKDIAAVLREQRVSAFPVIDDDNHVIGVVSEADLLSACDLGPRQGCRTAPQTGKTVPDHNPARCVMSEITSKEQL